jgi:transposase InsO family protein
MPFEVATIMDQRLAFVLLARVEGANIRALCRRFGISPKTAYTWLRRYAAEGQAGLADRSHRPHASPMQTAPELEAAVLALRTVQPTWGGRKLRASLLALGLREVPAASTITAILRRHDCLTGPRTGEPRALGRFEHATPNALWQLDFMGHRALRQGRVHPLTLLDDHSRFALALVACAHERAELVQQHLIRCFQTYGLPEALLADNGPTWGSSRTHTLTWLEAWLMRLGIRVVHGRPRHPQTQGKIERWHRTIAADVFQFAQFPDLEATQRAFDRFRSTYNTDRPHEALGMQVPGERYLPSARPYPERLPEIEYSPDHTVYRVTGSGRISINQRQIFISEALRGLPVGVRPTSIEGVVVVRFCNQAIKRLDLRNDA